MKRRTGSNIHISVKLPKSDKYTYTIDNVHFKLRDVLTEDNNIGGYVDKKYPSDRDVLISHAGDEDEKTQYDITIFLSAEETSLFSSGSTIYIDSRFIIKRTWEDGDKTKTETLYPETGILTTKIKGTLFNEDWKESNSNFSSTDKKEEGKE